MMSKDKWFVVRKPSTGEIIVKSANQIVLLNIGMRYKNIQQIPPPLGALKGGLGTVLCTIFATRKTKIRQVYLQLFNLRFERVHYFDHPVTVVLAAA